MSTSYSPIQRFILASYRLVLRSGMLSTAPGRGLFRHSYFTYKRFFEARHTKALLGFIVPNTVVVDVGANIGYFTHYFVQKVGAAGKVIAIEPEPQNCAELRRLASIHRWQEHVIVYEGAAADVSGTFHLEVDPYHFANHKLALQGIPVQVTTIDALLLECGNPQVSLIKIDVQGAEFKVLQGAVQTLTRYSPAIYAEVDEQALNRFQTSASEVLTFLVDLGYAIHQLNQRGISPPLTASQALDQLRTKNKHYTDYLFLKTPDASAHQ